MEVTQNVLLEQKVADVVKKVSEVEITMNELYDYQINPNYVNDSLSEFQDKNIGNGRQVS